MIQQAILTASAHRDFFTRHETGSPMLTTKIWTTPWPGINRQWRMISPANFCSISFFPYRYDYIVADFLRFIFPSLCGHSNFTRKSDKDRSIALISSQSFRLRKNHQQQRRTRDEADAQQLSTMQTDVHSEEVVRRDIDETQRSLRGFFPLTFHII